MMYLKGPIIFKSIFWLPKYMQRQIALKVHYSECMYFEKDSTITRFYFDCPSTKEGMGRNGLCLHYLL